MPRVDNIGANVDRWYADRTNGNGSSTFDVCKRCGDTLNKVDPHAFDKLLQPFNGDPPGDGGRGGDVDHPPYEDEDYKCEVCKRPLTAKDN